MSTKTRIRRRLNVKRRANIRRSASRSATTVKQDAKQQNALDGSVQIGGAHDPAEKAADAMAAQALGQPKVHRMCAQCNDEKKEETAQRSAHGTPSIAPGSKASPATTTAAQSIKSLGAGRPLSHSERAFFEPRFDRDFSSVRLHEGERAHQAAQHIDASAFTYGNNIAFANGERQRGGTQIMAHELAHVAQQDSGHTAHRQAAPAANCETCPNPVNPEVTVTITPLIQNGTPSGSPFGSTNWGSARMRQLSVWHRERRTCDTCNTANGSQAKYQLCPRKINVLATVPLVIDRAEITRSDPATGRDWWTECGPNPGADRFNSEAGTGFTTPKQKTVAGVLHHERYHVGVSERLLRQRIQARNDIHEICPYNAADIQTWKSALETTLRADAEAFLQGNPNEANEETNASNAECTQY